MFVFLAYKKTCTKPIVKQQAVSIQISAVPLFPWLSLVWELSGFIDYTVFLVVCWLTVITFPCICHKHTRLLKNSAEVVRLLWSVGHWSELTDNHLLDSVIFQLSWSHKPFSRLQHHSYSMSSLVRSFQKCQDTMKNVCSKIKTAWGNISQTNQNQQLDREDTKKKGLLWNIFLV